MEFSDHLNRAVVLKGVPKRIVSLVPSQTELLYDLGLRDEVVGITKFCVHPKEWFHSKERVGGTKQLNFDKIRALNPDLIIANKEENNRADIELLEKEFPVWVSEIKDLNDARNLIKDVGDLIGRHKNSEGLLIQYDKEFLKLKNVNGSRKRWSISFGQTQIWLRGVIHLFMPCSSR